MPRQVIQVLCPSKYCDAYRPQEQARRRRSDKSGQATRRPVCCPALLRHAVDRRPPTADRRPPTACLPSAVCHSPSADRRLPPAALGRHVAGRPGCRLAGGGPAVRRSSATRRLPAAVCHSPSAVPSSTRRCPPAARRRPGCCPFLVRPPDTPVVPATARPARCHAGNPPGCPAAAVPVAGRCHPGRPRRAGPSSRPPRPAPPSGPPETGPGAVPLSADSHCPLPPRCAPGVPSVSAARRPSPIPATPAGTPPHPPPGVRLPRTCRPVHYRPLPSRPRRGNAQAVLPVNEKTTPPRCKVAGQKASAPPRWG